MWRQVRKEMKAKKENKIYQINTDQEKQRYLKEGFDVYDDDGNVQEYSPQKKISYSEYIRAVKEIEHLQDLAAERYAEIETLKAENAELKAEHGVQKTESEPDVGKKAGSKKAGE